MLVIILNKSKKKSFRTTKRIVSVVLPQISNRLNAGDIPKRIIIQLILNLRQKVTKGTSVEVYIQDSSAYHGMKLVQIGTKRASTQEFTMPAKIDRDLKFNQII